MLLFCCGGNSCGCGNNHGVCCKDNDSSQGNCGCNCESDCERGERRAAQAVREAKEASRDAREAIRDAREAVRDAREACCDGPGPGMMPPPLRSDYGYNYNNEGCGCQN